MSVQDEDLGRLDSNIFFANYVPIIKSVTIIDAEGEHTVSPVEFFSETATKSGKSLKD